MPTDLPKDFPRPTNPGTGKVPEDPSDTERDRIIGEKPQSDIPDPVPTPTPVPGLGGEPVIM